jgi:hypothetical protein
MARADQGISCEFIVATASDSRSRDNSVLTKWSHTSSVRGTTPASRGITPTRGESVGWGEMGGMSPAREAKMSVLEEEDIYRDEESGFGDVMEVDEGEEVPPTQQERYQGIFDML